MKLASLEVRINLSVLWGKYGIKGMNQDRYYEKLPISQTNVRNYMCGKYIAVSVDPNDHQMSKLMKSYIG